MLFIHLLFLFILFLLLLFITVCSGASLIGLFDWLVPLFGSRLVLLCLSPGLLQFPFLHNRTSQYTEGGGEAFLVTLMNCSQIWNFYITIMLQFANRTCLNRTSCAANTFHWHVLCRHILGWDSCYWQEIWLVNYMIHVCLIDILRCLFWIKKLLTLSPASSPAPAVLMKLRVKGKLIIGVKYLYMYYTQQITLTIFFLLLTTFWLTLS